MHLQLVKGIAQTYLQSQLGEKKILIFGLKKKFKFRHCEKATKFEKKFVGFID